MVNTKEKWEEDKRNNVIFSCRYKVLNANVIPEGQFIDNKKASEPSSSVVYEYYLVG